MTVKSPVLVLNASYEPISIVAARRALTLLVKGRALTEESYDVFVWRDLKLPSVIRLKHYRRVPDKRHMMTRVTRRNIFTRDNHTCQYCGDNRHGLPLTLDHIVPSSKGGKDEWENLATSCFPCNHKKADHTLEEAGMKLLVPPRALSIHTARHLLRAKGAQFETWRKYLYY